MKKPTLIMSITPILFMVLSLSIGYGVYGLRVEPILILSGFVASIFALTLGVGWVDMQKAIIEKIARAMPATLILWSVGLLIGSWMFSGTVPMMIYYGVQIINPKFLLVTAFLITAMVSVVTGTSWGSVGTIGVAIMGIAAGLGVSLPATAGAVVAGGYFGDKISPLSDTTNLAPIAAGSNLYEHIRHMFYTTIPATIVSIIVYLIAGMHLEGGVSEPESVSLLLTQLDSMFSWNIVLLLPVLIIIVGSIKKLPTLPTMLGVSLFSVILGVIIQGFSLKNGFVSLIGGFNISMTSFEGVASTDILKLLNRGGVVSVTATTVLVFCAMGFAGIMSVSGMLDVVLHAMLSKVKTQAGIICSTILSCVTMAIVTGSSYLTILIPGELFRDTYIKRGLHPKNLSRTLEDSGTVIVPLVPWSAAGAYMATTLGVSTFEYIPWAVLNYTGVIVAVILAVTGFGVALLTKEEQDKYKKDFNITD